tara:strand:+ start:8202 stop:9167 length:966 start_codon:yes stop_codon:yes gene_type:complete
MTIEEFKETDPNSYGNGNINLLFSSSVVDPGVDNTALPPYVIQGLAVPFQSQEGTDLREVLRQVDEVRFAFASSSVDCKIIGKQKRTNYYYYKVEDLAVNSLPIEVPGLGFVQTDTSLVLLPYSDTDFYNSDYNPIINNSEGSKLNVVAARVDRYSSQTIPTNLQAIITGTATKAEIQNCSYTKMGVISGRYVGGKTTGAGSSYHLNKDRHAEFVLANEITSNSPALSFKQFQGSVHTEDATTSTIKAISQSDRDVVSIFFNAERVLAGGEFTIPNFPSSGSFIYIEEGNKLVKAVDSKVYSIDKGEVYTSDENARITLIE